MAGRVDSKKIRDAILSSRAVRVAAINLATQELEEEKSEAVRELEAHPVTQEILGGESAQNISGTLGGYGNLFSFIGFRNGSDPMKPVINLLLKTRVLKSGVTVRGNYIQVRIDLPTKEDFGAISKMPWESGRSWLWDIERSISGLGSYLYGKFEASRSGAAVQARKSYSKRRFLPTKYFSPIYSRLVKRITGRGK